MHTIYGIKNCSTMKKAFHWLDEHGIDYRLHDYKTAGIDSATVAQWLSQAGRESLVNRRGTTWRKLTDTEKETCLSGSDADAAAILAELPTLIKRPVLPTTDKLLVGFDTDNWAETLTD